MSIFDRDVELCFDKKFDIDYLKNNTEFDNDEFFLLINGNKNTIFFGASDNIKNKEIYQLFNYHYARENILIHKNKDKNCKCFRCENISLKNIMSIKKIDNSLSMLENMANIIVELNLKKVKKDFNLILTMNKNKFLEVLQFYQFNQNNESISLKDIYAEKIINKTADILNNGFKANNNQLKYINLLYFNKAYYYSNNIENEDEIKNILKFGFIDEDNFSSGEIWGKNFLDLRSDSKNFPENECINVINRTNLLMAQAYYSLIKKEEKSITIKTILNAPIHLNFMFVKGANDFVDVLREVGFKDEDIILYLEEINNLGVNSEESQVLVNTLEIIDSCHKKLNINKSVNAIRFLGSMSKTKEEDNSLELKNRYYNLLSKKEIEENKKELSVLNPQYFNLKESDFYKEEEVKIIKINLDAISNFYYNIYPSSMASVKMAIQNSKFFHFLSEKNNDLMFLIDKQNNISAEDFIKVIFKAIQENSTGKKINDDFSSELIDLYFREYFLDKKIKIYNSEQNNESKVLKIKNKI